MFGKIKTDFLNEYLFLDSQSQPQPLQRKFLDKQKFNNKYNFISTNFTNNRPWCKSLCNQYTNNNNTKIRVSIIVTKIKVDNIINISNMDQIKSFFGVK